MKNRNYKRILGCLLLVVNLLPMAAQDTAAYQRHVFISESDTLGYRMLLPKDFDPAKQYPLLLFLHGAGERGSDNEAQLTHGGALFLRPEVREEFPAIVVFPQAPKDDYWAQVEVDREVWPLEFEFKPEKGATPALGTVIKLVDSLVTEPFVDSQRLYVGGLSMGGMGTFELLYRRPETFAAAFAICGGADPKVVEAYRYGFPIWIFHGEQDDVVAPSWSKMMAREINSAGGDAKLSLYPQANHNSWDAALSEPNLLPWLFSKKYKKKNEEAHD